MHIWSLGLKLGLAGFLSAACIPILWVLFSFFEPQLVLLQAARVAGGRPYCIVVSEGDFFLKYKEVTSRSELAFNNLVTYLNWGGTDGPRALTYYALLVLQKPDDVWNWSKQSLDFQHDVELHQSSLVRRDPQSFCSPIVGFADKL